MTESQSSEDSITTKETVAQRSYKSSNLFFDKKVGRFNKIDVLIILLLVTLFPYYIGNYKNHISSIEFDNNEKKLTSLIDHYRNGQFYLSFTAPFGIQLLSMFSNANLRCISLVFNTGTLLNLYLILRRANINQFISIIPSISLAYLPIFEKSCNAISLDVIVWYFFTFIIYLWNTLRVQDINATTKICIQSFMLSIVIGLLISTKFIGFITWLWILCASLLQFWNLIADVTLTTKQIMKVSFARFFFILTVPLIVFSLSEYTQLSNWTVDTPEYSQYMSAYFKTYLRGQVEVPATIYHGATVRLRHSNSLGGYLTSYNETYKGGSGEQMVTVSDLEDTEWNLWTIEPSSKSDTRKSLDESAHILLRHKMTNKLLRASTAKPPISEQEYDKEVSCTGDADYQGDRDEYWRINSLAFNEKIKPMMKLRFRNIGQACFLLSHSSRLPASWDVNDQETLCIDSVTESYSVWELEIIEIGESYNSELVTYGFNKESLSLFRIDTWVLLGELLYRQFQYDYLVENFRIDSIKPTKWPFYYEGDALVAHCWLFSIVAVILWITWFVVELIKINPWDPVRNNQATLTSIIFCETSLEYMLGFFFHYYIFSYGKHNNLSVTLYFPSYICGELLFASIVNALFEWNHNTVALWAVYLSFIIYKIRN